MDPYPDRTNNWGGSYICNEYPLQDIPGKKKALYMGSITRANSARLMRRSADDDDGL